MTQTRVLITGSRTWDDMLTMYGTFLQWWEEAGRPEQPTLVSGHCPKGADAMAEFLWERNGWPVERHPADWENPDGSQNWKAGFERNHYMVTLGADVCIAFIHNKSNGATHCASLAQLAGIPTIIKEM